MTIIKNVVYSLLSKLLVLCLQFIKMASDMQPYKLASSSVNKQPFKIIEIPLTKFTGEVIPHHEKMFEDYKRHMNKVFADQDKVEITKHIKEKKKVSRQIKDLMYELDTLRTQVQDVDLDKFDVKTLALRKTLLKLISGYADIEKTADRMLYPLGMQKSQSSMQSYDSENPFEGAPQLKVQCVESVKLHNSESTLTEMQNINREVQDLHEMYEQLHGMIDQQAQSVEIVEESVASTSVNVESGTGFLSKAAKLKVATYPLTGAFLGTIIGGPIGLLAGIKFGGAAAVGCALAGYTGGKYLKESTQTEPIDSDTVRNENTENEQFQQNNTNKNKKNK